MMRPGQLYWNNDSKDHLVVGDEDGRVVLFEIQGQVPNKMPCI